MPEVAKSKIAGRKTAPARYHYPRTRNNRRHAAATSAGHVYIFEKIAYSFELKDLRVFKP
jgi:hypothetical protein